MSDFHFLRPWWLLALAPTAFVCWLLFRKADARRPWQGIIEPHLLQHLLLGDSERSRTAPLVWLLVAWLLGILALAGPTWRREPAPFADDTTALVIVLKVTPSMQSQDIQPTRLARSVEKIHDLLALRPGSKTALLAYSGSAHIVLPLTSDSVVVESFAAELDPTVLPREGDAAAAALAMASTIITKSGQRGWILWIADAASSDQLALLREYRAQRNVPVSVLAVAAQGPERTSLSAAATALGTHLADVTPDSEDVKHLAGNARFSTAVNATGERWQDAGYYLVPALAFFGLAWFRRGWVLPTGGAP